MQAKLFMIPWLIELVVAQRTPIQAPSAETLTNDLLVDAHQRNFYEMLRRQQQINDALLRNNALLHSHIPRLPVPAAPLPPAPFFNPFIQQPLVGNQGSTSKLGTYEESETVKETKEAEEEDVAVAEIPEEKEGTVEAPSRADATKKTLAGVKTVLIQRKGEVDHDSEVVRLLKKLSLSKEEQNGIVKHMEQLVREELLRKLSEVEAKTSTTEASTTTTTTMTTTTMETTTAAVTTTTTAAEDDERIEEEVEEEEEATTVALPKLQIRSEEKNVTLLRNNLKLHPIKLQSVPIAPPPLSTTVDESEEVSQQGSIKTSLTHLPIIVVNEEEDVTQKATLHSRVSAGGGVVSQEKEASRDVLVDFATGAPLDLTEVLATRGGQREPLAVATTTTPRPTTTTPPTIRQSIGLPRQTHHEVTNFERLATDYRHRLENTGDINKILQKISENAYISLVERGGGPRKLFGV